MRLESVFKNQLTKEDITNDVLFEASSKAYEKEHQNDVITEGIIDRIRGSKSFDYDEKDFQNLGILREALNNGDFGALIGKSGATIFTEDDLTAIRNKIHTIIQENTLIDGNNLDDFSVLPMSLHAIFNTAGSTLLAGVAGIISYWAYQLSGTAFSIGDIFRELFTSTGVLEFAGLGWLSNIAGYGLVGAAIGGGLIAALHGIGAYRQARVLSRLRAASKAITASRLLTQNIKNVTKEQLEDHEKEYYEYLLELRPEEAEEWFQSQMERQAKEVQEEFQSMFDNMPVYVRYRTKQRDSSGNEIDVIKEYPTSKFFKR